MTEPLRFFFGDSYARFNGAINELSPKKSEGRLDGKECVLRTAGEIFKSSWDNLWLWLRV
jgi:hypothetical protein